MTVKHHYALTNTTEAVRRQTAIHRKCLMLLQARSNRNPTYALRTVN